MKGIISIIALLLISGSSFGQFIGASEVFSHQDSILIDSIFVSHWDYDINDWVPRCLSPTHGGHVIAAKTAFTYDGNGYLIKHVEEDLDWRIDNWDNPFEVDYLNDVNGNHISMHIYQREENSDDSIHHALFEYTYDENNSKTSRVGYHWSSEINDWAYGDYWGYEDAWYRDRDIWADSAAYFHDEQGYRTSVVGYNWNKDSMDYRFKTNLEVEYDENGNQTFSRYSWGSYRNNCEYNYDENGNLSMLIRYGWDTDSMDWYLDHRYEIEYDEHGNQVSYIRYGWDEISLDWEYAWKDEFEYDEYGNQTLITYNGWDTDINDWYEHEKQRLEYFYTELNQVNAGQKDNNRLTMYPNPSVSYITIETGAIGSYSIEIISQNGQVIHRSEANENPIQLNLSSYSQGIYFITIRSGDFEKTEKIIIQTQSH